MNDVQIDSGNVNMVQVKNERHSKISSPPRRATAERHETLRAGLLEAAKTFIETNGLAALRARTLAEDAGCSVGAIYNVFADLDALILAVNAVTLAEIGARMAATAPAPPAEKFQILAGAYLDYAVEHRRRWDALFTHRLPAGVEAPDWFMSIQAAAFSHIETPLLALRPDLPSAAIPLLARGIFAAVHGVVAFGLEHRTGPIDLPALRAQLTTIAAAIAHGLAAERAGADNSHSRKTT
jgi:AcrR family transcriptional regulator